MKAVWSRASCHAIHAIRIPPITLRDAIRSDVNRLLAHILIKCVTLCTPRRQSVLFVLFTLDDKSYQREWDFSASLTAGYLRNFLSMRVMNIYSVVDNVDRHKLRVNTILNYRETFDDSVIAIILM